MQARDGDEVLGTAGLGSHWEPERAIDGNAFRDVCDSSRTRSGGRSRPSSERCSRKLVAGARPRSLLEVTSQNAAARALYERCGFVATGALHPHPRNDDLQEIEMVATL